MQVVRGFESHRLRQKTDNKCALNWFFSLRWKFSYDLRHYNQSEARQRTSERLRSRPRRWFLLDCRRCEILCCKSPQSLRWLGEGPLRRAFEHSYQLLGLRIGPLESCTTAGSCVCASSWRGTCL